MGKNLQSITCPKIKIIEQHNGEDERYYFPDHEWLGTEENWFIAMVRWDMAQS